MNKRKRRILSKILIVIVFVNLIFNFQPTKADEPTEKASVVELYFISPYLVGKIIDVDNEEGYEDLKREVRELYIVTAGLTADDEEVYVEVDYIDFSNVDIHKKGNYQADIYLKVSEELYDDEYTYDDLFYLPDEMVKHSFNIYVADTEQMDFYLINNTEATGAICWLPKFGFISDKYIVKYVESDEKLYKQDLENQTWSDCPEDMVYNSGYGITFVKDKFVRDKYYYLMIETMEGYKEIAELVISTNEIVSSGGLQGNRDGGDLIEKITTQKESPTTEKSTTRMVSSEDKTTKSTTENKTTENKPTENKPTDSKPAESNSTENKTTENKPTENKPTENKTTATENNKAEDKTTENQPTESNSTENYSTDNKTSENLSADNRISESKQVISDTEELTKPNILKLNNSTYATVNEPSVNNGIIVQRAEELQENEAEEPTSKLIDEDSSKGFASKDEESTLENIKTVDNAKTPEDEVKQDTDNKIKRDTTNEKTNLNIILKMLGLIVVVVTVAGCVIVISNKKDK